MLHFIHRLLTRSQLKKGRNKQALRLFSPDVLDLIDLNHQQGRTAQFKQDYYFSLTRRFIVWSHDELMKCCVKIAQF